MLSIILRNKSFYFGDGTFHYAKLMTFKPINIAAKYGPTIPECYHSEEVSELLYQVQEHLQPENEKRLTICKQKMEM